MPPEKSYPAVPCKWKRGYGYVVVYGADTLIYQPYIPAIGEKTAFTSEEDALKIGTLVCRKLAEKQPPTVSREEIVENLPSMRLPAAGR